MQLIVNMSRLPASKHNGTHILTQTEVPAAPRLQEPTAAGEDPSIIYICGWKILPLQERLIRVLVERYDAISVELLHPERMLMSNGLHRHHRIGACFLELRYGSIHILGVKKGGCGLKRDHHIG